MYALKMNEVGYITYHLPANKSTRSMSLKLAYTQDFTPPGTFKPWCIAFHFPGHSHWNSQKGQAIWLTDLVLWPLSFLSLSLSLCLHPVYLIYMGLHWFCFEVTNLVPCMVSPPTQLGLLCWVWTESFPCHLQVSWINN